MGLERWVVGFTVVVIALLVITSGPLVGGVDLTSESTAPDLDPGTGSVTVDKVSVQEDGFRLTKGQFDSSVYYLKSTPVRVEMTDLRGQPVIEYELRVEELDYVGLRSYFLGTNGGGNKSFDLQMPPQAMNSTVRPDQTYQAKIILTVWDGEGERVVYRENVSVGVA